MKGTPEFEHAPSQIKDYELNRRVLGSVQYWTGHLIRALERPSVMWRRVRTGPFTCTAVSFLYSSLTSPKTGFISHVCIAFVCTTLQVLV